MFTSIPVHIHSTTARSNCTLKGRPPTAPLYFILFYFVHPSGPQVLRRQNHSSNIHVHEWSCPCRSMRNPHSRETTFHANGPRAKAVHRNQSSLVHHHQRKCVIHDMQPVRATSYDAWLAILMESAPVSTTRYLSASPRPRAALS